MVKTPLLPLQGHRLHPDRTEIAAGPAVLEGRGDVLAEKKSYKLTTLNISPRISDP